ncbi:MAG TPA: type IV pilus twitching motility protein PilT [Planctomycetota bacterium]|nr:type IV pilus twitching motility protein PilT [Planctomycetota bacterium]
MDKLLELCVDKGVSDLHLSVGSPPVVRLHGRLKPLTTPPLTPEDTTAYMKAIAGDRAQHELAEKGGSDFGFGYHDRGRFRVSIFKQKGAVGLVLRQIPTHLLSLEEIGLPAAVRNLCLKPRGMVLVTGPTGSGKTTTLASMIDFVNSEVDRHIITIEDPIEYFHVHKKSLVTQREVGVDVGGFYEALRRALRQDPDVILLGEMRDLETISAAITAAETGHLVFGTLHTTGAAETIHRIVDAFPPNQQEQVRAQLSTALIAVISQTLMPVAEGKGRIAAFELMVMTSGIAHLIRENKIHRIDSEIQTGGKLGMQLLDDHLLAFFRRQKIKYQMMMEKARNPVELEKRVREEAARGPVGVAVEADGDGEGEDAGEEEGA